MVKFTNVTDDAYLDKSKFKRWTYTPTKNNVNVYAPYEGIISGINPNKGLLKIKHKFGNEYYITKIYDLGSINKSNGDKVIAGELIGKSSDKPFNLEIVDSGNLEQLITPFFTGSVNLQPEPKPQKEKETPKEKEVIPKEKEKFDKYEKGEEKFDKYEKSKENKNKYVPGLQTYEPGNLSLLDVGLVPFHLLGMAGTYLKNRMKRKKAEKDDLQEELIRIKQLLK